MWGMLVVMGSCLDCCNPWHAAAAAARTALRAAHAALQMRACARVCGRAVACMHARMQVGSLRLSLKAARTMTTLCRRLGPTQRMQSEGLRQKACRWQGMPASCHAAMHPPPPAHRHRHMGSGASCMKQAVRMHMQACLQ